MSRRLCLVTGASAGIGAAFARTYAAHGYDVALTARRAERLDMLAKDLRGDFGVEAYVLPADLALADTPQALVDALKARGRTVDALINNAGYGLRGDQAEHSWADHQAFLQVLVAAPAALAHLVAPAMVAHRFGRIVNVASVMGLLPSPPGQGLYSPAKAFLVKFSEGLHLELRAAGVHVTALCPGLTRSEFHAVAGLQNVAVRAPGWMWMSAEDVAEAGYAAAELNRPIYVPGAPNKAMVALARILPESLGMALMDRQTRR